LAEALTHDVPEMAARGLTFTFITDGIESAIEQAKAAAGEKNVTVIGGGRGDGRGSRGRAGDGRGVGSVRESGRIPSAARHARRPAPPPRPPTARRSNWRRPTPSAGTLPAGWRRPPATPDLAPTGSLRYACRSCGFEEATAPGSSLGDHVLRRSGGGLRPDLEITRNSSARCPFAPRSFVV
jgi:hypothetical protein